jgi:hypothetical protein
VGIHRASEGVMVMIVETSSNQLFDVRPADGIDHAWIGTEVKRVKGGGYAPKANARPILVRKAGSRVTDSSNAPDPRDPRPDHEMIETTEPSARRAVPAHSIEEYEDETE